MDDERERDLRFMWFTGSVGAISAGVFGWTWDIGPIVGGGLFGNHCRCCLAGLAEQAIT